MAIIKPGQLSTGSYSISGSFSGSFYGDGSNLINIPTQSFETGSFVTTSSFDNFTGSYNTGSFTGSFTGSLTGTSSYATTSLTASYALTVSGSTGLTIGSTAITSGTDSRILYQAGGVVQQSANLTFASNRLNVNNGAGVLEMYHDTFGGVLNVPSGKGYLALGAESDDIYIANGSAKKTYFRSATTTHSNFTSTGLAVGWGSTTAGAKLDVKAQGALSTDTVFRIRNSADTLNFTQFNGDGTYYLSSAGSTLADAFSRISDGRMFMAKDGGNFIELNPAGGNRFYNPSPGMGWGFSGNTQIATVAQGGNTGNYAWHFYTGNLQIGTGLVASNEANGAIWMSNGTAPSVSYTDRHWYYSADVAPGTASAHFRNEAGHVIKLYQQSAVTSSQGLADVLTNLGFLTGSSAIASPSAFPYTGSALITGSLGITGSTSVLGNIWSYGPGNINTNTAFGQNVFESITSGYLNTTFGKYSLQSLTSGYENNAFGYMALNSLTSGYDNTAIGYQAGRFITTGTANTAVGAFALQLNTSAFGYNTAIGYASFQDSTGEYNTGVGYWAGKNFTTGQYNTVVGFYPVTGITTGGGNTIMGSQIGAVGNISNNVIIADGVGNIAIRKDSSNYVGIGYNATASLGAKLDIKAQGALSSDLIFRVRNSADTRTNFEVNGLGQVRVRNNSFYGDLAFISYVSDTGTERDAFKFSSYVQNFMGRTWTFDANTNGNIEGFRLFNDLTGNDQGFFTIQANNYCFGTSILAGEGVITERRVMRLVNGVAPSTNVTDGFKLYSADRDGVNGKASPHFRTEDGTVVWFGDESRLFNVTASNITASNVIASSLTVPSGSVTITTGSITMPNRPAFSVYGSGTTNNLTTTQNTTGTLNSNNYAVSFYQGSGFDSGSGIFTAPIAGLYQVDVVGRNSGYSSGISQLAVLKNNSNGSGDVLMIEWAASSTMNHAGGSKIYKLAVGDTLRLKVLAGEINFDGNDNWSVAYIG